MSRTEPQITEIASYLATALPTEGSDAAEATQAWRHTLRYARQSGAIEPIAEMIAAEGQHDPKLAEYSEALRS